MSNFHVAATFSGNNMNHSCLLDTFIELKKSKRDRNKKIPKNTARVDENFLHFCLILKVIIFVLINLI